MDYRSIYSSASRGMKHSFIREILKVTKGVPGIISFAGGMPHPSSFPKNLLADLFSEVIRNEGDDVLQYGASDGDGPLKQAVRRFEDAECLAADELMVTVGSTNGIYYFARTLIEPGDVIITENPSFPGSITALEGCGARLEGIPMDDEGMDDRRMIQTVHALRGSGKNVKFLYLIPEFQNPSGCTMSLARRRAVIAAAIRLNLPILEDQPYRELRYHGERIPTLWEIARTEYDDPERVTIVKSYSKILGPGLRLGFAAGAAGVIGPMIKWQEKVTVSPDNVAQRVTAKFMERGLMHRHIEKIVEMYRPRQKAMLNALKQEMPKGIYWTRPEGGMFVWLTLPGNLDARSLFRIALEEKVAFIPGETFFVGPDKPKNHLRLNFSYPDPEEIKVGVRRLSRIIRGVL